MNFMKIRLSTVLWAITVACLAFGWFWERSQFQARLDDQVETQVSVECSLTAALYKNLFSARLREVELGEKSEQEFEEFRRYSLVENIIYLYLNEKWATNKTAELGDGWTHNTNQAGRIVDFAGWSMDLLEFDSAEELESVLQSEKFFFDFHGEDLFDKSRNMKPGFRDFVLRAVQHYKSKRELSSEQ